MISAGPKANEPVMAAAGIEFVALPDYPLDGPRLVHPRGLRERLPAGRSARLSAGLEALGVSGLPEELRSLRPDLVLIDCEMHAHIMTAAGLGFRVALFTGICAGLPGWQAPPNHTAIIPGRGLRGTRPGVAAAWIRLWLSKGRRRLVDRLRFGGADYVSVLREHARRVGFDYRHEITAWRWQIPFSYARLPLLLFHAREFDLPAPTSDRILYVGPMIGRARVAPPEADTDFETMMTEVAARRHDPAARLVYVAFGTVTAPRAKFLARLWETARRNPELLFVVSAGRALPDIVPKESACNLRLLKWVPQLDVLRIADAAIIHAGSNTIIECIEAGVPMLCYPVSTIDRMGNAARISYHGLGVVGDKNDSSEEIAHDLRHVIFDHRIRDNIARMQRAFRQYAEDRVVERTIEQLLDLPRAVP